MKKYNGVVLLLMLLSQRPAIAQTWIELGGPHGLGAAITGPIYSICSDKYGNIYAGGNFEDASGNPYVAKFDGTRWSELGGVNTLAPGNTNTAPLNYISTLCSDPSGNIYAGGGFTDMQGANFVAKFDGSSWSELNVSGLYDGAPLLDGGNLINCVYSDPRGNIYAGCGWIAPDNTGFGNNANFVATFIGIGWSVLDSTAPPITDGQVSTICTDPLGNVYAGGFFDDHNNGRYVVKWNGLAWVAIGDSLGSGDIWSMFSDGAGNIYAAGSCLNSDGHAYVAKYNGTHWSELGGSNSLRANGMIQSICLDKFGNVYAAGFFTDSAGYTYVAKYDGRKWSSLGSLGKYGAGIESICTDPEGNIYAAGLFEDSSIHMYVAKYAATSGINELSDNTQLKFFPNPSTGQFTVMLSDKQSNYPIEVFNMLGEKVYQSVLGNGQNTINLSNQSAGVYFINMQTTEGVQTSKVMITK